MLGFAKAVVRAERGTADIDIMVNTNTVNVCSSFNLLGGDRVKTIVCLDLDLLFFHLSLQVPFDVSF